MASELQLAQASGNDTHALSAPRQAGPAAHPIRQLQPPPQQTALCIEPRELWLAVHVPGLIADEQLVLKRLARFAQRFTPRVSLEPPDGLLLEIKGSLQLFGGVQRLYRAFRAACVAAGVRPIMALAPTPLAALAGARAGIALKVLDESQLVGAVAPLPLSGLRWPPEVLARLAKTGVHLIGQALRLPRAGFARRFGTEQLASLDRLVARSADLRLGFQAPERFRMHRSFTYEKEHHAAIVMALTPLLEELGRFLQARQCGVTEISCQLRHRQEPHTSCVVRLAASEADAERLIEWFALRLATLVLPGPVRGCVLRTGLLVPHAPAAGSLWQPGEHGGGGHAGSLTFIERLRARLGTAAVYGLQVQASHRPEGASRQVALEVLGAKRKSPPLSWPGMRPIWMLATPELLSEISGRPQRNGPLQLRDGPERIETGWWEGGEVARDYYRAIDAHGVRLWIFRERQAPHRWFLQGLAG
ncbi:MAG TPA: DNA polymerase Y family protein [Steroidobacteraceae bacterium]|jgi:protein ImuB